MILQRREIIVIDDSDNDDDGEWNEVLSPSQKRGGHAALSSSLTIRSQNVVSHDKPRILILVGIPGSGKSTLAQYLTSLNTSRYIRVNQDELKTRNKCETLTRTALKQSQSPIIDRCNFDPKQRSHFIRIAQEFNVPVDCIVLDISVSICLERCLNRNHHPTIDGNNARAVVGQMANLLVKPHAIHFRNEGIERMKIVTNANMIENIAKNYCFHGAL
jgi:predicted kinase